MPLLTARSASLVTLLIPRPQLVIPPVPTVITKIALLESVLSARLGASHALLQALPAAHLAHPSISLLLSTTALPVILSVTGVLQPVILLVKLVPPISSLSRILLSHVWLLVQTTLPTSSLMAPPSAAASSSHHQAVLPSCPMACSNRMLGRASTSHPRLQRRPPRKVRASPSMSGSSRI